MSDADTDDGETLGEVIDDLPDADSDADTESAMDSEMELIDASRSCSNCAKQDVCAVYGNMAPQVAEEIPRRTGGEPAFDPDDIAMICGEYDPVE
jgi:hypothetical protein